jgi:hypothetical protein
MSDLLHAEEARRLLDAILDRPFGRDIPSEVGIHLEAAVRAIPVRKRGRVAQGPHLTGYMGDVSG